VKKRDLERHLVAHRCSLVREAAKARALGEQGIGATRDGASAPRDQAAHGPWNLPSARRATADRIALSDGIRTGFSMPCAVAPRVAMRGRTLRMNYTDWRVG
jgi:hypothetical protein